MNYMTTHNTDCPYCGQNLLIPVAIPEEHLKRASYEEGKAVAKYSIDELFWMVTEIEHVINMMRQELTQMQACWKAGAGE